MAAPHQRHGDADAGEVGLGDLGHSELRHQRTSGRQDPGRAGPVDGVVGERGPLVAETTAEALDVVHALAHQSFVGALSGLAEVRIERLAELRGRCERGKSERVDEHQLTDPFTVLDGEAGGDRTTEHAADDDWWRGAGLVDDLRQPGENAPSVELDTHRRLTVAGKVRGDHVMALGEAADDRKPPGGEFARAVQEHHGIAGTALEQHSRDPCRVDPPFTDFGSSEQAPSWRAGDGGLLRRVRGHVALLLWGTTSTVRRRPRRRIGRTTKHPPNVAWVILCRRSAPDARLVARRHVGRGRGAVVAPASAAVSVSAGMAPGVSVAGEVRELGWLRCPRSAGVTGVPRRDRR